MMQQKDVIFVEVSLAASNPNEKSSGVEALEISRELGYRNIVLAQNPQFYGANISKHVDRWIACNTQDIGSIVEAVDRQSAKALLTFSDLFVEPATRAASRLGLRSTAPDSPAILRDKAGVRKTLDAAKIPNPDWAVVSLLKPIHTSPIGYPCIVKPIDGSASWDVRRVSNDDELQEAVRLHLARKEYGRGIQPKHAFLFEKELEGPLFSAEGFSDHSEVSIWGYSDRLLINPPFFVEASLTFSSVVPQADVPKFVRDILAATRYNFGPFHMEFILTQDGPRLVELNPRLIGGGAHECINLCSNHNVIAYIMRKYLGEMPEELTISRASTQRDTYASKGGVVKAIHGIEVIQALPGVVEVVLRVQPGKSVTSASSNSESLGYLLTIGETAEEAIKCAELALTHLEIEIL